MDHFAGLDGSVKETSVCIVDDTGKIVREVKVASEPKADRENSAPLPTEAASLRAAFQYWALAFPHPRPAGPAGNVPKTSRKFA